MNMLQALGATPPAYAHVPMILGPDGAKLSKRHGAVSVLQYEEEGYLPTHCSTISCASAGRTATRRCSRARR